MFVQRDLTDSVPTPEGNMHYVKQGSGYPLVMLHPLGTSTWAWSSVIDALSQHYTCYAFDMLGHGESDKPSRHFNLPDYANALDHACQILNIHRGHYVGNSVGAVLATEMAASFPERLDKLVLVGCPVFDCRTAAQRLEEGAARYDENGLPKPSTFEEAKAAGTSFANPQPEWVEAMNQTRTQAGIWVKNLMEALSYYDIMSRLPQIKDLGNAGHVRRARPPARWRRAASQQYFQRQQVGAARVGTHSPNRGPGSLHRSAATLFAG